MLSGLLRIPFTRPSRHVHGEPHTANNGSLLERCREVLARTWRLGLTGFGGPAVQFQLFRRRFVDTEYTSVPWVDEQVYQELFSLSQGLPGPATTKVLICLAWIRAGAIPAVLAFFAWALPVAIAMLCLAIGVQRVDQVLPSIVYAFLTGVNASIVGVIALAGTGLAEKSMSDGLSRILIIFGACAGAVYSALWYFPILMLAGAVVVICWDLPLRSRLAGNIRARSRHRKKVLPSVELRAQNAEHDQPGLPKKSSRTDAPGTDQIIQAPGLTDVISHGVSIKVGMAVFAAYMVLFITVMIVPRVVENAPRLLSVFGNILLAGTITAGGGPVLIPLMREYVVEPGWVNPRDFLIGLAIIQTCPGPNFNFAVYLGYLSLLGTSTAPAIGGLVGFVGIFLPGCCFALTGMSVWRVIRHKPVVTSLLRGVNCTAVGLVFTAVYRLWQIGYLSTSAPSGQSLGNDPFWFVVAVLAYSGHAWFRVPILGVIVIGGTLGLAWYGVRAA